MSDSSPRIDPQQPVEIHRFAKWRPLVAIAIGLLYGLLARVSWGIDLSDSFLGTPVSSSFLFAVPVAMGAIVAFVGMLISPSRRVSIWGVVMPVIALVVGVAASVAFKLEAAFCVVVAMPLLVPMVMLGGLLTTLAMVQLGASRTKFYVSVLVLFPYLIAPIEQLYELPEERLTVTNTIEIAASPEQIWAEIASVPEIHESELRRPWIYRLGFPRPRAATLDYEGVGGKRIATFEREVSFFEVIETWEPPKTLSFSIEADPAFIPANAFDEHIIIGGRFYDVLDGIYRIEKMGAGRSRLILTSHHRLATQFNSYASWWSEVVMSEIQKTILEVIARRAEAR